MASERELLKWISSADHLPCNLAKKGWFDNGWYRASRKVVAFNGSFHIAEALTDPTGRSIWVCGDETIEAVSHWMPLPQRPGRK